MAAEKIIEFFKENNEIFVDCIEELDSWNGYLGDDRYYEMCELDDFFNDTAHTEILTRAFCGHDECYGYDSPFNPNRDYFRFNGYGNLVSSDTKDYSDYLDSYLIETLSNYRNRIDAINSPELSELFDEYEKASNE